MQAELVIASFILSLISAISVLAISSKINKSLEAFERERERNTVRIFDKFTAILIMFIILVLLSSIR